MRPGVLRIGHQRLTPRTDIDWLDLDDDEAALKARILEIGHSRFLLARGSLDDFVGVALAKDLMRDLLGSGKIDLERSLRQPLVVHESVSALRLMEQLRASTLQMAVVIDEYGSIEGIAAPTDILEAIAGDFVDENEEEATAQRAEDGSWLVDGWIDIRSASNIIRANLSDAADRYSTLAGYILWQLGNLPSEGQRVAAGDYEFEIVHPLWAVSRQSRGKVEPWSIPHHRSKGSADRALAANDRFSEAAPQRRPRW